MIISFLKLQTYCIIEKIDFEDDHHSHVSDEMIQIAKDDFKPFYHDLYIKERYLQGAYLHPLKISKLIYFFLF